MLSYGFFSFFNKQQAELLSYKFQILHMHSIIQYLEHVFFLNSKPFKSYNNKNVAHKQFCNRPPFWYLWTRPGSFVRCTLRFFDYPSLMTSDIFLYHFLILEVLLFFYVQPHMCKKKIFWIFVECLSHGKFNSGHFMKSNFFAWDRYLRIHSEKTEKKCRARLLFCK